MNSAQISQAERVSRDSSRLWTVGVVFAVALFASVQTPAGTVTYQQASVDTFAESIGQTGNALFKEHCRAVAVELQEEIFAETNSFAAQISGRPPMTIEEFVARNRAAFI